MAQAEEFFRVPGITLKRYSKDYEVLRRKTEVESPYSTSTTNDYEDLRKQPQDESPYSTCMTQDGAYTNIGCTELSTNQKDGMDTSPRSVALARNSINRQKIGVIAAISVGFIVVISITVILVYVHLDQSGTNVPHPTEQPDSNISATTQATTSTARGNQSYEWSEWEEWTQCTATCGSGFHTRYRHCNKALSSLCAGNFVETELCSAKRCPVNGKWTTWSSWGSCDVTCGGGSHIRTRTCIKVDAVDRDCTGEKFQKKTCSQWNCPDCNQTCTVGVLNERCDTCVCKNSFITGRIFAKATGNPIIGAALYARSAPTQLLALSNSTGFFSMNATCTTSEILITKEGFIDTTVTINDIFIEVYLTRIVKPFLTETPQSKYRLSDENVTLCCKASAKPNISYYEWFKDNILFDRKMYKDETQLVLTYLNIPDSGNYHCRANSDTGAIMSPVAVLTVKAEPDHFCMDALQQKTITLPKECMQPGTNSSEFEVGDCLAKKCRAKAANGEGTCQENIDSCCSVKEYHIETVNCTDYELNLFVVNSCGCAACLPSKVLISGVVTGLDDGTPVKYASVYLNGEVKDYTTTKGLFRFSANSTGSRLTITVEDFYKNFLPSSKVIDVFDDLSGIINVNIKMIKAADPEKIDSTMENTLSAGFSDRLNVSNVQLAIPANAFSHKNGSLFSGTVETRLTFLDPLDISNAENIPGVFQYIDNEGQTGDLASLGVFNINFQDQSGQALVLNQVIEAYIPIGNEENETYKDFKLWTLNSQTGIWELVEENTEDRARKKRQRFGTNIGTLTDISAQRWYNYDEVSQITRNQCYFKVRLFRDAQKTETIYNPLNDIQIHTNIIRGRILHTISHTTRKPDRYCINVPCQQETAYITGKTEKQTLFAVQPHPNNIIFHISSDKTVLQAQMTSNDSGPFYQTQTQCLKSSYIDSYLGFSYGIADYEWKFQPTPKKCIPETDLNVDSLIRQRHWYPYHEVYKYRVCFVKIRLRFNSRKGIDKTNMKLRVFSYGGDGSEIQDLILGIHESEINDSVTYCLGYRCSGYIDICNASVFDYTKVKIILEYPKSTVRCLVNDTASDLRSKIYSNANHISVQFQVPFVQVDSSLGLYTSNEFYVDDAYSASKDYCMAGTYDPNNKAMMNLGYAVSFYCE